MQKMRGHDYHDDEIGDAEVVIVIMTVGDAEDAR